MGTFVLHYLTIWKPLGYSLMFLGMLIEGEIVLFTVAFLTHQRFFDFGDAALTVMVGVFVGDILWYHLGSHLNHHFKFIRKWMEKFSTQLDSHLVKNSFRTIFLSKFAYGLNKATMLRAGSLQIPFKKFLQADLVSSLAWIAVIGTLGYVSSASLLLLKHYLRFAEIGLAAALLLFLILNHYLTRLSEKEIEKD